MYIQYYIDIKDRGFNREISENRGSSSRIRGSYIMYNVFLYRKENYIKRFYSRGTIVESKEQIQRFFNIL